MPIELLVPIIIFTLGTILAVKLGGMGIELITEGQKK